MLRQLAKGAPLHKDGVGVQFLVFEPHDKELHFSKVSTVENVLKLPLAGSLGLALSATDTKIRKSPGAEKVEGVEHNQSRSWCITHAENPKNLLISIC